MDKGTYLGTCNRTVCQKPPANWFHWSTQKWYCETCGVLINEANSPLILCQFANNEEEGLVWGKQEREKWIHSEFGSSEAV